MAQTGFTPIQIYSSSTAAAAPVAGNLTNSTLGSELAINITDGKLFYKDNANAIQVIGWKVVPATAGGTGQTSYTQGDLLYATSSTTLGRLADVVTGNALISGGVGSDPTWGKIGLTTHVSGTLGVGNGGTGTATAFTAGSVIFAGASGVYSQDNANFFWDSANARLGIGSVSPPVKLTSVGGTTSGAVDNAAMFAGGVSGVLGSGAAVYLSGSNNVTRAAVITGVNTSGASNGHALVFSTSANSAAPTERGRFDSSGNFLITGIGVLGYGTGSGGAVTQATSRTNGVTLDKSNGAITLVSAAGTTTWQSFTVTNNKVATTDTVVVSQKSGTDLYQIFVTNVGAGSFRISFATTGGTTTEQPVFNFVVIKAVTA
jgi:hypothetical protein